MSGARDLRIRLLLGAMVLPALAVRLPAAEPDIRPLRDFAAASAQAKRFGVPMLLIFGDAAAVDAVLAPKMKTACRRLVVAWLPAGGGAAKSLEVTGPAVLVVGAAGEAPVRLAIDANPADLLAAVDAAIKAAGDAALGTLRSEQSADEARASAAQTLGRLGVGAEALMPLLQSKKPVLRAAAQSALAAMGPAAVPHLFEGLASDDAELRAACAPATAKATGYPQAPPAAFWKTEPAEKRAEALAKWRTRWAEGETGRRIVEFCTAHIGRQVGDGECGTLAVEAMQAAGAQRGNFSNFKNYIWGRLLAPKEELQPGDILQLEDAQFVTPASINTAAHHTVGVVRVTGPRSFEGLESNTNGRKTVGPGKYNMAEMTRGSAKFYRPLPGDSGR